MMLLRSSSSPLLKQQHYSCLPQEPKKYLSTLIVSSLSQLEYNSIQKKMSRASSESDLNSSNSCCMALHNLISHEEDKEDEIELTNGLMLLSNFGLEMTERHKVEEEKHTRAVEQLVVDGGGSGGDGRGKKCGGDGDGDGDSDGDSFEYSTDLYYTKMIQADPGNSLLLGNYARFLKEVSGNMVKAEEYCERAILANPSDGNVLSFYADLIWRAHKDVPRANNYFHKALKVAPNDCYVLASYAHFLWDVEDEEEEEEEQEHRQYQMNDHNLSI
ncbi:uncharacterized protein [Solanum lycopersicum]|uniref:uncharacterized protein isoform X1 n=1 Tax=Solanum lycopersicum TaxID=4081 RepID=UPI00374A838E